MTATKAIPPRSAVKQAYTWDLKPLFQNDAAWERAFKRLEKMVARFDEFRGRLADSAQVLRDCCVFEADFEKKSERLGSYAFLKASEDVANGTYQAMTARVTRLMTRAEEAASFIGPEIQRIPKRKMKAFLEDPVLADFRFQLEKLLRYRPYILPEAEERVLAMQGEVAGTAARVFDQLNDADLKFGFVTNEKGEKVELSQSSFITLLESPKRAVRRKAFHQFYAVYEAHANTVAATLNGSILQDVYRARVRNYPSSIEAALFHDDVPVSVYDSLIDAVDGNLDTVYRYLEVRRKVLGLKEIHIYDCYVPLVPEGRMTTPYEKAVEIICEALAPLGRQYTRVLERGLLSGRWVDRYENKGKRSGAFSAGAYTGPPYILMNYKKEVLDSVFTLAHEAGHSMHTYFSARHQPFQYYDYEIFVAEVASTFNEQLLNKYLLERAPNDRVRAFLINRQIDEIRGTLVRQTMFAEFEKILHAFAEAGEPLTLEVMRHEYEKLLRRYFGEDFFLDDALSLECLRIPHFYRAFYVYKYATGISAAIALSERVLNGGKAERDAYLRFLKGGGSKFPLELLRDAGVDMAKPDAVATAMSRLRTLVDELEKMLT